MCPKTAVLSLSWTSSSSAFIFWRLNCRGADLWTSFQCWHWRHKMFFSLDCNYYALHFTWTRTRFYRLAPLRKAFASSAWLHWNRSISDPFKTSASFCSSCRSHRKCIRWEACYPCQEKTCLWLSLNLGSIKFPFGSKVKILFFGLWYKLINYIVF
jgi:hypothetical protein